MQSLPATMNTGKIYNIKFINHIRIIPSIGFLILAGYLFKDAYIEGRTTLKYAFFILLTISLPGIYLQ